MAFRTLTKYARVVILVVVILDIVLKTVEGCGYVKVTNLTDVNIVTSPNFPENYPHNIRCTWKFTTIPEQRIKLVFTSFKLEAISDCRFDYVALYDGQSENSPLLGSFCNELPPPVISTSHDMLIVFNSDRSNAYTGFKAIQTTELNLRAIIPVETESNATEYLVNTKRQHKGTINKWGTGITRTAVALLLYDPQFFAAGVQIEEEIAYELTLQLMSKLVLKKRIYTKDLALFVNALTVACIDPKNFFGVNIINELRKRVDSSNEINPFFILALCNGGDHMKTEDVHKLQQLFHAHLRPSWTDTQAMVVMALKCISRQTQMNLNTTLTQMVSELKRKQQNNGTIDNLKTTALVIQALMATESYRTEFNMSLAIKSLLNDMNHTHVGIEEYYYILPIFKWKSLLDINSNHCDCTIKTDLQEMIKLSDQPDERIEVQISIVIGDDMDFSRTWRIKIPSNYSFYQVLENITATEPDYKLRYVISEGKPYVAGLASFQDSIEDGSFWFIFTKPLSSTDNPILIDKSPVDIQVNASNELILWYRSKASTNTEVTTTSDITDVTDATFSDISDSPSYIFDTTGK